MSRLDFACSLLCIDVCVLHLKFTVSPPPLPSPFLVANLLSSNETRSNFQLRILNVNHDVVGLPTTSGFVLTLTRFVTRTFLLLLLLHVMHAFGTSHYRVEHFG